MIFTVISKALGEKKTKMLGKNEVRYLCAVVPCTVFKRENLESHSHAIYKGYQNLLLVISGHHGDKD